MNRLISRILLTLFVSMMAACQSSKEQAIYLQNLRPYFWSSDESFIYVTYANYKTVNEGDINSHILKIDVNNGSYEQIFEDTESHPNLLSIDRRSDSLVISFLRQYGLFYLQKDLMNDLIDTQNSYISKYSQYSHDYQYMFVDRVFDSYSEWGRYKLSDASFLPFKSVAFNVQDIGTLNIINNSIYLSNYESFERVKPDKPEQHRVGKINSETAEISDIIVIPPYSEEPLRFRIWLSEDEMLFSVTDEDRLEHKKSVSYSISQNSYSLRPDFQQDGILSPSKKLVAYVKNGVLMTSNADGTGTRIVLDSLVLPKGAPRYLALL